MLQLYLCSTFLWIYLSGLSDILCPITTKILDFPIDMFGLSSSDQRTSIARCTLCGSSEEPQLYNERAPFSLALSTVIELVAVPKILQ